MRQKPTIIGLTGSIGMGKSTTAGLFREMGIPVWDADAQVHKLYQSGGDAVPAIGKLYPKAIVNGAVDRNILKQWITSDKTALAKIEKVVHPLIEVSRNQFIESQTTPIIMLDIPLLFENGLETLVDLVIVVSIDATTQRARVLDRGTMTTEQFEMILAKQMPDETKRAKADYVVTTDSIASVKQQIKQIIQQIGEQNHA